MTAITVVTDGPTHGPEPRTQLPLATDRRGDTVDPTTWAGSVPQVNVVSPWVRVGRDRWFNPLGLLPIGLLVLMVAVAAAKGLRNTPAVQELIAQHPGTVASTAAVADAGFPI